MILEDDPPDTQAPITQVVRWIRLRNWAIAEFWSNAHGWAPPDASELLERSRLDLQVELSETLHLWVSDDSAAGPMRDGHLILAWSNLGALVEGTLKWFLSVFLDDYRASILGPAEGAPGTGQPHPGAAASVLRQARVDRARCLGPLDPTRAEPSQRDPLVPQEAAW